MLGQRGESETELFHHPHRQHQQLQQESASSSYTASPAHRARPQPEYKVVNVKEPPLIRDSSFNSIHTSVEIVVVVSLICATSELVLGFWVMYLLSRTSFHTSSSKYITIGVGMFIAQSVRIYALLTWLKSSKQVLEAFLLVAGFDLLFSICFGSIVACYFQSRLQRRQTYLRWAQINRGTAPSTESSTMPPTGAPLHLYRNLEYYHYQHHHHRPQRNHSTMVAYV